MNDCPPLHELFIKEEFVEKLQTACSRISFFRETIRQVQDKIDSYFYADCNIEQLIQTRSDFIDIVLSIAWQQNPWPDKSNGIALLAVGGYGRRELHPYSDIDLLILLKEDNIDDYRENIEKFITFLWDLKLNIGHSVRTIEECQQKAKEDITIATNLMECRTIIGNLQLRAAMLALVGPDKIWPNNEFFEAKRNEQIIRHRKFNNTEYNLEPNLKSSPGGLRDIQVIGWVAKRHYGVSSLESLIGETFISAEEYKILESGRDFLWKIRYALHLVAKRPEDRLLFEHQREIAKLFHLEDTEEGLAVEQLMQRYYRWSLSLSELNEILLQNLDEAILRACEPDTIMNINKRFQIRNNYIEAVNDKVFINHPPALIEIFVLAGQNQQIEGIRASTIRLIGQARSLVNDEFRQDPRNQKLFMRLLRVKFGLYTQLRRMKRYGILGLYIPEFGRVIGKMQYDLFHIYTVDEHTLLVIKNMRLFRHVDAEERFPVAAHIVRQLPKIELLYLAGFFHDIAKGRGGDHSTLGATDAESFCLKHGLSRWEANLVAWLVEKHLLMSSISQRKDVSDPDVVNDFALVVGDQIHLDYIYALTVADIIATNPNLWNSWRASLLRQLYLNTKRTLRRGLENPVDKYNRIEHIQQAAIAKLADKGFTEAEVWKIWDEPGDEYFWLESPKDIVWHTEGIALHGDSREPLILIKDSTGNRYEGATQIFIHSKDQGNLFAAVANSLDHLNLNIHDARVYTSQSGNILDTFFVLDENGLPIGDNPQKIEKIKRTISKELAELANYKEVIRRRTPRQLKHFAAPTRTTISNDLNKNCTVLEVVTPDRPGLLAHIGRIFVEFNIEIQSAKITTLGERVEDVFFITDQNHEPISDPELCEALQNEIRRVLDKQVKAAE